MFFGIIFLLMAGYIILTFLPSAFDNTIIQNDTLDIAPYPRWDHMPITYFIQNASDCEEYELTSVYEAIDNIQEETDFAVTFMKNKTNPDILFLCINLEEFIADVTKCKEVKYPYREQNINVFEDGHLDIDTQKITSLKVKSKDGSNNIFELCYLNFSDLPFEDRYIPDKYAIAEVNVDKFGENVIKNSSIYLYYQGQSCVYPSTEVHEILHVFGFAHNIYNANSDWDSKEVISDIMYPYLECGLQNKINPEYSLCLKDIYLYNKESSSYCDQLSFFVKEETCSPDKYISLDGTGCCQEEKMYIDYGECYFDNGCYPGYYPSVNLDNYCCTGENMIFEGGSCFDANFLGFEAFEDFEKEHNLTVVLSKENNLGIAKINLTNSLIDIKSEDEKDDFVWDNLYSLFLRLSENIKADNYEVIFIMTFEEYIFDYEYSISKEYLSSELDFLENVEIDVT